MPVNLEKGMIKIKNKYDFTNLSAFNFDWEIVSDGSVIQSGKLKIPSLLPKQETEVTLPLNKIVPAPGTEYFLNIKASRTDEWNYVPEDHVYATAQFKLPFETRPDVISADPMAILQTKTIDKKFHVSGVNMAIVFDLEKGTLESFKYKGKELIKKGPEPDFWRPPTDNDYGHNMDKQLGVWKKAGERSIVTKADIRQKEPGKVEISFKYKIMGLEDDKIADFSTVYTILGSSDIVVKNTFVKSSEKIPEIPRMGMQLQLPVELSNLKWLGRGPHENYVDRWTSADVGLYESTAADQYVPYIRPQENGYKTETRWLTLTDDSGSGIMVSGYPVFCFEALQNIHDDFESPGKLSTYRKDAKSANTHSINVKPRDLVNLNIDLNQMGVGGDNSWGAQTHPQYRLLANKYEYSFRIRPIVKEDDILKLAKEKF
jgi:beta-galactosidase